MNSHEILRKLAKTNFWQTIYSQSKEIYLPLFKIAGDYTDLQINFLYFLSFYSALNDYIYLGEVHTKVLEHNIYEDSYMYWKNENRLKPPKPLPKRDNELAGRNSQWIFRKRTKDK